MNFQTLQLAYNAGVATITLNRPEKRNAISYELIQDLLAALAEVKDSSAQVMILTGAGKAFCSGMDLENLKALIGRSPLLPDASLRRHWRTVIPSLPIALRYELAAILLDVEQALPCS